MKALEEWRPELEGTRDTLEIITDYKNLQTFGSTKQLTPRHMRWSEFLSRFNFRIKYRPGTLATLPDALSRKPEDMPLYAADDRLRARRRPLIDPARLDPNMYGEEDYARLELYTLDTSKYIDDLITESYEKSAFLNDVLAALEADPAASESLGWPPALREQLRIPFNECTAVQGKAYYRGRLIVDPEDRDLQLQLIYRTHASTPTGHPGRTKTLDLMNRRYWWPGLSIAVREFCKACPPYARTKPSRSKPVGFLKPLPLPLSPWRDISVDYITPLPPSNRRGRSYRHVAVVVDRLTKMRHFIAKETLEAEELMDAFLQRVYSLHGCPETIISDRGSQFVSAFWRALSARLGITLRPSSAYHPQTNGQTERINAELEKYLRAYISWPKTTGRTGCHWQSSPATTQSPRQLASAHFTPTTDSTPESASNLPPRAPPITPPIRKPNSSKPPRSRSGSAAYSTKSTLSPAKPRIATRLTPTPSGPTPRNTV